MAWYYYTETGKEGPFNAKAIRDLALEGVIRPETLLENTQGKQARARSVEGLVFSEPVKIPEVLPVGTPAVPENGTVPDPPSEEFAMEVPDFPGTQEVFENTEKNEPLFPPPQKSTSSPIRIRRPGIWDVDLSRFLGDPGVEVDLALLKNMTNMVKLTYWLFCIFYWLYAIGGAGAVIAVASQENEMGGIAGGLLIAMLLLLLAGIVFFFFRLYMKLPIELLKYFMHSYLMLKEIRQELKKS
ncbi:MAG: hypothetical protein J6J31_01755 [Thermoguttaceae bacterium]|nr:hypothetical protein [Thermoguttaceae bacterium]